MDYYQNMIEFRSKSRSLTRIRCWILNQTEIDDQILTSDSIRFVVTNHKSLHHTESDHKREREKLCGLQSEI